MNHILFNSDHAAIREIFHNKYLIIQKFIFSYSLLFISYSLNVNYLDKNWLVVLKNLLEQMKIERKQIRISNKQNKKQIWSQTKML